MSCAKFVVVALVAAAAAATVALAKPSGIELSIVKDRTICKTEVDYDIDDSRVPRVIKVLKCAADSEQDKACPEVGGGGRAHCCGQAALDAPRFTCAELLDSVTVSDKTGMYSINVPVGCACVQQHSNEAQDVN